MLCFHTSDTATIVGLDPPNPMVNQYISLALAQRSLGLQIDHFLIIFVAQLVLLPRPPLCQCQGYILVDHWVRGVQAYYYLGFRPRRPLALHWLGLYLSQSLFSDPLCLLTRFAQKSLDLQHYLKSLGGQRESTITPIGLKLLRLRHMSNLYQYTSHSGEKSYAMLSHK